MEILWTEVLQGASAPPFGFTSFYIDLREETPEAFCNASIHGKEFIVAKRKITKQDVDQAFQIAADAKKKAMFSLGRARQLKDGAYALRKQYNANKKKK